MNIVYGIELNELELTNPYTKGKEVRLLQILLNANGFSCGATDGIYGNKTMLAVQKANAKFHINANYCKAETWIALLNN